MNMKKCNICEVISQRLPTVSTKLMAVISIFIISDWFKCTKICVLLPMRPAHARSWDVNIRELSLGMGADRNRSQTDTEGNRGPTMYKMLWGERRHRFLCFQPSCLFSLTFFKIQCSYLFLKTLPCHHGAGSSFPLHSTLREAVRKFCSRHESSKHYQGFF